MNFLAVAFGGAIGAAGRYAISLMPVKAEFPVLTLLTNVLGAILIGFIAGVAAGMRIHRRMRYCSGRPACAAGLRHFPHFHLKR